MLDNPNLVMVYGTDTYGCDPKSRRLYVSEDGTEYHGTHTQAVVHFIKLYPTKSVVVSRYPKKSRNNI